jgi:Glycoside hydrolase family 44
VAPLLTVPTIGWVARDDQTSNRSTGVPPEGGAPVAQGSPAIAGYDPSANRARTSVMSLPRKPGLLSAHPDPSLPAVYQDEWIHHLVTTFGPEAVRFLTMDNEPDLWSSTHTDIHPVRMGYDDMLSNFEDYATAMKAVAPSALILGPDVSGWTGYWYSDLDRGTDNFATHADRRSHSDTAFLPWWLSRVAQQDRVRGSRSLDLLDVHYYPQASQVTSTLHDPKTQYLRIQSVRSLYDPTFVDPSWIAEPVNLIPRLKQWIAANYPGTGVAITEYKWGGEEDASGAVALAESLGIFGREGVDVAAYWTYPKPSSPAGAAFRMYRNFDGKGGHFGNRALVTTSSVRAVQAFAARDSVTGVISVMLVNESFDKSARVRLETKAGGRPTADVYRLTRGAVDIEGGQLSDWHQPISLPPLSVTLVRLLSGSGS